MTFRYIPIVWQHSHDKFSLSDMNVCEVKGALLTIDEGQLYSVVYINQIQSMCKHLDYADFVNDDTNYIAYVYLNCNSSEITDMRAAMVSGWCLDDIVHILDSRFYISGDNARPYTIIGIWVKVIDDADNSVLEYVRDYCRIINSAIFPNDGIDSLVNIPLGEMMRCMPKINTRIQYNNIADLTSVLDELPKVFSEFPVKSAETDLSAIINTLASEAVQANARIRVYYHDDGGSSTTKFEKILTGRYRSILLTSESILNHEYHNVRPTVHITPTITGATTIVNNAKGDDITVWAHWYMLPSANVALLHSVI